jgi:hypothetical protein
VETMSVSADASAVATLIAPRRNPRPVMAPLAAVAWP